MVHPACRLRLYSMEATPCLLGDHALPACNKSKAIRASNLKHNTLIINKQKNVHPCMTKVYILIIHHK